MSLSPTPSKHAKSTCSADLTSTASGVLANFGGINLTFMFIATLGSTGILTVWLHDIGINLSSIGFNLYTFSGVSSCTCTSSFH